MDTIPQGSQACPLCTVDVPAPTALPVLACCVMARLSVEGVSDALYVALEAEARRHHRTVSEHVVEILQRSLAREQQERTRSVLELQGLGKKIWDGVDAVKYVHEERRSWK